MNLKMFPIPKRNTVGTDHYRMVPTASYGKIHRLLVACLALQLATISILLAKLEVGQ